MRDTVDFLRSPEAHRNLKADPYWPKWDSPWWRMTLLWEMGLSDRIPRGLAFVVAWAERRRRMLPADAVKETVTLLSGKGTLIIERRAFEKEKTLKMDSEGRWSKGKPASTFPLLDEVSLLGRTSPELSRQWRSTLGTLRRLEADGFLAR